MLKVPFAPAFMLAGSPSSLLDRWLDNPFAGVHHLDFFDYAILIPYFAILIVLSCYGLHRYEMIRGYWKYRKNLSETPPLNFEQLPRVTIQLPLFNERYVVERLL